MDTSDRRTFLKMIGSPEPDRLMDIFRKDVQTGRGSRVRVEGEDIG